MQQVMVTEWQKSSYCGDNACVEVGIAGDIVAVRDAKRPGGPVLQFGKAEWNEFVDGVRAGEFQNL
jgi:predicted secreted Zn-dependent protease